MLVVHPPQHGRHQKSDPEPAKYQEPKRALSHSSSDYFRNIINHLQLSIALKFFS